MYWIKRYSNRKLSNMCNGITNLKFIGTIDNYNVIRGIVSRLIVTCVTLKC